MTTPSEHVKVNEAMRRSYRTNRFSVDNSGRLLRGPSLDVDAEESTEEAPSKSPGRADGGAQGAVPVDPIASINDAIRSAAGRRGQG